MLQNRGAVDVVKRAELGFCKPPGEARATVNVAATVFTGFQGPKRSIL